MSDKPSSVISFMDAKIKRGQTEEYDPVGKVPYMYEYNLNIKITMEGKIHAIFQTYDFEVPEEEQYQHLLKILEVMKAGNPNIDSI